MTPSKVSTSLMGSFLWGQNEGPAGRSTGFLPPVYRLPAIPRKGTCAASAITGFRNAIVLGARDATDGSVGEALNKKILQNSAPAFRSIKQGTTETRGPPCSRAARSHSQA